MLTGIKLKAYPTREQKKTLSQWMGCARFIYNAKCAEDKYFEAMQESIALSISMPLWIVLIVNLKTKSSALFFLMFPVSFLEIALLTGINPIEDFLKASLTGQFLRKKVRGNRSC